MVTAEEVMKGYSDATGGRSSKAAPKPSPSPEPPPEPETDEQREKRTNSGEPEETSSLPSSRGSVVAALASERTGITPKTKEGLLGRSAAKSDMA